MMDARAKHRLPHSQGLRSPEADASPLLADTHCHLNHHDFAADLPDVLARARLAGVERIVCAGFDIESSVEAVRRAHESPMVYATAGIHPHDASKFGPDDEERLMRLCREERVVAVGETGLDYHYDLSPRDVQQRVYRLHIRMAQELDLPLVIHSREAGDDILDILEDEGMPDRGAVLHCFSGDVDMARRALGIGCYLGIAGPITFRNADDFRRMVQGLPLGSLLIETDAPYLAPHPHRGKRNEPAYARLVAEKLAEVKGFPLSEVTSATTSNAVRLFRFEV